MSDEPAHTVAATPSGDGAPRIRQRGTTAFGRGGRRLVTGIGRMIRALWTGLARLLRGLWSVPARVGRGVRARLAPVGRAVRSGARGLRRSVAMLVPWVVTAVGFASGAVYLRNNHDVGEWAILFSAMQTLPVAMSAYRPMAGWAVSFIGALSIPLLALPLHVSTPWPWTPVAMLTYPFVQYFVARNRSRTVSLATWAIMSIGVTTLMGVFAPARVDVSDNQVLFGALALVGLVIGDGTRVRRQARERVAEQQRLSAEERMSRQLLEERTRIARELHDVVAHHMSVIAVQASTAAYRLEALPESARDEFTAIGDSARESLAELRRLLSILRSHDESAQRTPQPGLDRLDELVDATRRAGSPVTVLVGSLPSVLPDVVGLTAYRLVQEALSNVVRHAPGASTRVEVSTVLDDLRVSVENDPPDRPRGADGESTMEAGGGHGIVGMRERVETLGGRIHVGPRPDGGFRVEAVLPTTPNTEPGMTPTT